MPRAKLTGEEAQQFAKQVDQLVELQASQLEEVAPSPRTRDGKELPKQAANLKGVQSQLGSPLLRPKKTLKPDQLAASAELLLPSVWCYNKRHLKGEPLRFMPATITKYNLNRVRPFLEQPLNDDAKEKGYRKARQIGLSENSVSESLWFADVHPHTKVFYTFPTNRQMQDFSNTRIAEAIQESAHLQKVMGDIKNVNLKKVRDSFLFLRGAQAERLGEGVDADVAFFDEIDRMNPRVKVAFEESLQSSLWGWIREISTPTVPNFGIDEGWQKSKQWYWFIKCSRCNARQSLEWLPTDDFSGKVSIAEKDGIHVYVCRACGGELSLQDRIQGEWIAKFPSRESSYYQFNQLMAAWISAQKLWDKQESYPFKQLFYNYALGLPYLGDNILVTEEQIIGSKDFHSYKQWKKGPRVMGIDWGDKSWIVILQVLGDKIGLVHLERVLSSDVGEIVTQVSDTFKKFDCDLMVNDAGYGKDRNTLLLKKHEDRVFSCFYPSTEKGTSKIFEPQWQDESHKVSVDRTTSLKLSLGLFKAGGVLICTEVMQNPDLKTFIKHLTNLVSVKDFDEKTQEIEEWIASTGQDHFGHAWNYACTAVQKVAKLPKSEFWDWHKEMLQAKRDGTLPKEERTNKPIVPGLTSTQDILELSGGMTNVRPDKAHCYALKYNYDPTICSNCTLHVSCRKICDSREIPL